MAAPPNFKIPLALPGFEHIRRAWHDVHEAFAARLLPGEGELWLGELIAALPPGTPISIEAPSARMAGLPAAERARLARVATERFLQG